MRRFYVFLGCCAMSGAMGQSSAFCGPERTQAWAKPLHWLDVRQIQSTPCEFPASPPAFAGETDALSQHLIR